jgi:tetratricopeptide (TPR) repeat protein
MISSLVGLVTRTSDRLTGELQVDVGLKKLVKTLEKEADTAVAIKLAKDELRMRTKAVKSAAKELDQLGAALAQLVDVLPFTADGWSERKQALERKVKVDALAGIEAWLEDWLIAGSYCRTDALSRLESVELPAGASLLVERCVSARLGLEQRSLYLARPLLEAGANGIPFASGTVPSERVRADLRLLLVRLALEQGLLDEAGDELERASAVEPSPALEALRARWLRLQGESDAAADALAAAAEVAPADLDVAAELIETQRSQGHRELVLDTARGAVAAIPMLIDVEAELSRLSGMPRAVLWAAVAERALSENDLDMQAYAVQRAAETVEYGDNVLHAVVAELQARGAAARNLPDEECEALKEAGSWRVLAEQIDLAAAHYRRVLELRPDDDDAALRLADCLTVLTAPQPLTEARPEIEEALRLIRAVQSRNGITLGNSWSYLSEAVALLRLGEAFDQEASRHNWEAFAAVCRSLVHLPDSASRWRDLARAAQALGLYAVCVAASERAVELDPYDEDSSAVLVQSLTNIGRLDEALDRLGDPYDAWGRAVKAYILARKNEPAEAVALLRTVILDPAWAWASHTFANALITLGDRDDEARAYTAGVRDYWARRQQESEAVGVEAWTSVILDDLESAERCAEILGGAQAQQVWAELRFLDGDADGGIAALRSVIAQVATLRELNEVSSVNAGRLRALMRMHGLPPPDLAPLDDDLDRRRKELEAQSDAYVDLEAAPTSEAEAEIARVAKTMGAALMQLARSGRVETLPELQPLAEARPNDTELGALVALAKEPPAELSEPPAPPTEAAPEFPIEDSVEQPQLETELPTSWFDGYDNPLNDHPLFRHYIPELRARAWWEVPGIHVAVDDGLEPDGYRILRMGEVVDEGRASAAHRYASPETLALLPKEVSDDAELDDDLGLVRIPAAAIAGGEKLAELLTLHAAEVVVQRIGDIARRDAEQMGAGIRRRWPKRLVSALGRGDRGPHATSSAS